MIEAQKWIYFNFWTLKICSCQVICSCCYIQNDNFKFNKYSGKLQYLAKILSIQYKRDIFLLKYDYSELICHWNSIVIFIVNNAFQNTIILIINICTCHIKLKLIGQLPVNYFFRIHLFGLECRYIFINSIPRTKYSFSTSMHG
jgi:hypothetical protein